MTQEQHPIVLPSEGAQALASYLEQNDSFIQLIKGFANWPEDVFYEINRSALAQTIQNFYDSLL